MRNSRQYTRWMLRKHRSLDELLHVLHRIAWILIYRAYISRQMAIAALRSRRRAWRRLVGKLVWKLIRRK